MSTDVASKDRSTDVPEGNKKTVVILVRNSPQEYVSRIRSEIVLFNGDCLLQWYQYVFDDVVFQNFGSQLLQLGQRFAERIFPIHAAVVPHREIDA